MAQAREQGRELDAAVVYFDPMLASHVAALEGWSRPEATLIAVVADPPEPLLDTRARAELVAGLRVVNFVVPLGDGPLEPLLESIAPARIYRGEQDDAARRQDLIADVRSRENPR